MPDFRLIPAEKGIRCDGAGNFVLSRNLPAQIALWGNGPKGEPLNVVSLNPTVVDVRDLTAEVPACFAFRRILLTPNMVGTATVVVRVGPAGNALATANLQVADTAGAPQMIEAMDAPLSGAIPLAAGIGSVVRIPVPGTRGLAVELSSRGWTPAGGSTSKLFIQDVAGKRVLRLDYGYNVRTKAVDFHWNQSGTFNEFAIPDHTPAGVSGEALYRGAKYFKYGGRVLLVAAAAMDVYSIVVSSKPLRQATKVVAGWTGAWAGCEVTGAGGAALGSLASPVGTAVGAFVGCAVGGFFGYEGASQVAGRVYDWADGVIFTPVPESPAP